MLFFRNKLGLHVSNTEKLQKKTLEESLHLLRITRKASWRDISTELSIHFIPL